MTNTSFLILPPERSVRRRIAAAAFGAGCADSRIRAVAPGRAPRWVRRTIVAAFVLMAVVGGVVGLIALLTHYW
jgi:hypothetical protein